MLPVGDWFLIRLYYNSLRFKAHILDHMQLPIDIAGAFIFRAIVRKIFLVGGVVPARIVVSDIISITAFELPQPLITPRCFGVVVLVWVAHVQPASAQVTEVSSTPLTYHVVAAVGFLCRHRTGRAGCSVELDVFQGSFVLSAELVIIPWRPAQHIFPVPCLEAPAAESKQTIFTNTKKAGAVWRLGWVNGCQLIIGFFVGLFVHSSCCKCGRYYRLRVLFRSCGSLAETSWAVYRALIILKFDLVSHGDIPFDHVVFQWDQKKLTR